MALQRSELDRALADELSAEALLGMGLPPKLIVEVLAANPGEKSIDLLRELFELLRVPADEQSDQDLENLTLRCAIVRALAEYGSQTALGLLLELADKNDFSRQDRTIAGEISLRLGEVALASPELFSQSQEVFLDHGNPRQQSALVMSMVIYRLRGMGTIDEYVQVYQQTSDRELRRDLLANCVSLDDVNLVHAFLEIGFQSGLLDTTLQTVVTAAERWPELREDWSRLVLAIALDRTVSTDMYIAAVESLASIDPLAVFDLPRDTLPPRQREYLEATIRRLESTDMERIYGQRRAG